jgi:hypothetical protein
MLAVHYKELLLAGEASPQILNSIRQFLKDNEITCDRATASELQHSFEKLMSTYATEEEQLGAN